MEKARWHWDSNLGQHSNDGSVGGTTPRGGDLQWYKLQERIFTELHSNSAAPSCTIHCQNVFFILGTDKNRTFVIPHYGSVLSSFSEKFSLKQIRSMPCFCPCLVWSTERFFWYSVNEGARVGSRPTTEKSFDNSKNNFHVGSNVFEMLTSHGLRGSQLPVGTVQCITAVRRLLISPPCDG